MASDRVRYVPGQSLRVEDPYRPGDVIVKRTPSSGRERRYVVADPPRTSHGKLRLLRPEGTILTTWWGRRGDTSLPAHYSAERP